MFIFLQKDGKWNWSKAHPWQFWGQLYLSRRDYFDLKIAKYIELHNVPIPSSSRAMPPDHDTGRPAKRQKTVDDLDSQEEKLIRLVTSTPSLRERIDGLDIQKEQLMHHVASTPEKNTRVKEEPIVPTESLANMPQINETQSTHLPETVEIVDDETIGANEDDGEADILLGSEDYAGEIFEDIEENKRENGAGSQSGSATGDEGKIQNAKPTFTIHPSTSSQPPVEISMEKGLDDSVQVMYVQTLFIEQSFLIARFYLLVKRMERPNRFRDPFHTGHSLNLTCTAITS